MTHKQFVVIVPTNRPAKFLKFFDAWTPLFTKHEVQLIVMHDGPEPDMQIAQGLLEQSWCFGVKQLCWRDMTTQHIPTRTDMCRSFAFKWAYDNLPDAEYFLTLDDDVKPTNLDIFEEYEKVFEEGSVHSEFLDVGALTTSGVQMRGFPYKDRKKANVGVQYGGWHGVLDYDAATQLSNPKEYESFHPVVLPVPRGVAATCCIMNCAWQREYTPIMWQFPMLPDRYNRVGDIWSGLLIKKTLDVMGDVMVINGRASVIHDRASDPYNSLKKESLSVWLNDHLWYAMGGPIGEKKPMKEAYSDQLIKAHTFFLEYDEEYADKFSQASLEWLGLFHDI